MCSLISSFPSLLSLPAIVLLLHSFQSCLFLYPCVLCRHTPTWLSFTSVFFKDSLSLPLCLCSLPALCLCVISSLAVAHNAPRSHLPSRVRVEHKRAAVWIKHLRQCTHWAPLECRDEHWFWDRGLWPHTVSVCQCVLLSACQCIPLSSEGYHMFGFFFHDLWSKERRNKNLSTPRSRFHAFPGSRHILYFCTCLIFCLFCFKLFISLFFILSLSLLKLHSPFFLCFWSLHFILLLSLIHTSPSLPLNPSTTTTTTTPSLSCSHWSCQYDGYKKLSKATDGCSLRRGSALDVSGTRVRCLCVYHYLYTFQCLQGKTSEFTSWACHIFRKLCIQVSGHQESLSLPHLSQLSLLIILCCVLIR